MFLVDSQVVSFAQGEKLAASHGVRFLETSARGDINVTEAFENLATDVIQRYVFFAATVVALSGCISL